ncbi:YggS family pyridoxal phosphate enzyme [Capsulimonas corticalis]|uniref:Pyridoxal phosphate homeostasis protein n=1 Tax=Capsulimonas corticalis TaxID=2219043 RepID=A0A402D3L2_9BACT|nr:YggS family pyridoxal phosphate-dependent enzyme [Capsulimonas corticalis]BDI31899.1 YggS family pyridoxal phosphate enzyme [Capsulimonas corticalis]
MSAIAENVAALREKIDAAARRAGRSPEEITLVGVSKRQDIAAVQEAIAAGIAHIGENYVQEAAGKRLAARERGLHEARWHLIGHLQRNKAREAVEIFDSVQTVDSVKLAQALARQAALQNRTLDVLVEVHLGEEETKSGVAPEQAVDFAAEVGAIDGLALQGLMAIAPFGIDPRPYFRQLRGLFDTLPEQHRQVLSMGMSSDYETAIEEGTTMVRIGTAIFGARVTQ